MVGQFGEHGGEIPRLFARANGGDVVAGETGSAVFERIGQRLPLHQRDLGARGYRVQRATITRGAHRIQNRLDREVSRQQHRHLPGQHRLQVGVELSAQLKAPFRA